MFSSVFTLLYFLQLFFNQLAVGIGAQFPWTTFLFLPQDIFADSLKLTASYRHFLRQDMHWTAPIKRLDPWYELFNSYLRNPIYSDDPSLASSHLSHFMLPPFSQLFFIVSARVLSVLDPLVFLLVSLAILLLPACLALWILRRRKPSFWLKAACFCLISYPFVYALDRGHPIAILCGSLIILASTFYFCGNSANAVLLGLIATGFRPNLFPYVIFFAFSDPRFRFKSKIWMFGRSVVLVSALIALTYQLVHHLYPAYSLTSFLEAYGFYSQGEEEGSGFTAVGSSLYGAERIIFRYVGLYGPMVSLLAKRFNLVLGLLLSILLALSCAKGQTSRVRGLFLASLLILIETPQLADYHLFPFLALFIAPAVSAASKKDNLALAMDAVPTELRPMFIFSQPMDGALKDLNTIEKWTLCLMTVPLAFYLVPSRLISLGTFLRPALAVFCLAIWWIQRWKWSRSMSDETI